MTQDNSWYEKGELPPVGTDIFCVLSESYLGSRLKDFAEIGLRVEGHFSHRGSDGIVVSHPLKGVGAMIYYKDHFRPIKSDREKAIEEMENILFNNFTSDQMELDVVRLAATKLYDAGYRKTEGDA